MNSIRHPFVPRKPTAIALVATVAALLLSWAGFGILAVTVYLAGTVLLLTWLQKSTIGPLNRLQAALRTALEQENYITPLPRESHADLAPLVDDFNELVGRIRTREEALLQARTDLEQRVIRRTQELETEIIERKRAEEDLKRSQIEIAETNQQLEMAIERANQMVLHAELANVAKSEFLANMSHEI